MTELDLRLRERGRYRQHPDGGDEERRGDPARARQQRQRYGVHRILHTGKPRRYTISPAPHKRHASAAPIIDVAALRSICRGDLRRTALSVASTTTSPVTFHRNRPAHELAARLANVVKGDVMTDRGSCARYATDASIYEIQPLAVLVPTSDADVRAAIAVCAELGV